MEREMKDWWRLKFLEGINEEMAAFISVSENDLYQSLLVDDRPNSFFQSEWIVIVIVNVNSI